MSDSITKIANANAVSGKHKGGRRHFTNFEALEEQKKKEEKERQWRVSEALSL